MSPFAQVAGALVTASLFGLLARIFRQPLMLGYLVAGFVLAATGLIRIDDPALLSALGQIGVTFLLFLVGLEMNFKEIRSLGKVSLATGLGQIAFTALIGYFLALAFGFSTLSSLYIAVALTFSSTIIAVKLLSEKKDLGSLYGKISVGFLLVQDFVAILILIFLAGFRETASPSFISLFAVVLKGLVLVFIVLLLSRYVLPRFFDRIASSGELLFVTSIAWALGIAALMQSRYVGFSLEIGGFLAGLALANSVEHLQIASRVKPLRDFFITIFFLVLGIELVLSGMGNLLIPVLIFSLLVFLGNPLIVMLVMGAMGYHRRTSFLASVTVAQIFEFSFIVMAMGRNLGHVGSQEVALITMVGVLTMVASTYLINYNHKVYSYLDRYLKIFQREKTRESAFRQRKDFKGHIILVGADRTGKALLPTLAKREEPLLVVDFNPEVVAQLVAEGYHAIFGDVADAETIELLGLEDAKLVISTADDAEDDLILLGKLRITKKRPMVVLVASYPQEALKLYEAGADYVVVPRIIGGEHIAHVLGSHGIDREYFEKLRDRHFDRLARERYY